MARIGDIQLPNPFGGPPLNIPSPAGVADPAPDPAVKAQFLALAAGAGPNQQQLIVDMAEATQLGKRATIVHYAIGGVAGLAVGALAVKLFSGKKR